MAYVFIALLIVFVLLPRLWRYALADVLAAHRARTACLRSGQVTFRERVRRSGPWAWREGASA